MKRAARIVVRDAVLRSLALAKALSFSRPGCPALAVFSGSSTRQYLEDCPIHALTARSDIQWGVPICQGKVRYVGPSREWRVLVSEANAKALMEAAGCDASNMQLTWDSDGSSIPGVNECFGMLGYHPAWQAGGQSITPVGLPPGSYCQAATCMVNAETGAVSSTPQYCEVPG